MSGLCKKCGLCCRLIPVDLANRKLLRDGNIPLNDEFFEMLEPADLDSLLNNNETYIQNVQNIYPQAEFFKCKYLIDNNICSKLEKPQECSDFPLKPFAFVPEDCGYIGEQFLKIETHKQKIRKIKEEIIHYEALIETSNDKKDIESYKKIIHVHERYIEKYAIFGALDW